MLGRALVLTSLVALTSGATGCAAALRERVTPFPPSTPRTVPWTLNRELLTAANRRILILVELAEGHAPERAALDRLARLAARYGERPASWVIRGQKDAHDADTSYVVVRYVGDQLPMWGLSYSEEVGGRTIYTILINQERHRRWRAFLPEQHLEAQTLIHEYGHLLGLPPADHGYYPHYPDFSDGAHCVNPDCALAKPRLRAFLYSLVHIAFGRRYLEDYCAACRAAIAAAKQKWRNDPFSAARINTHATAFG